jgi:small neutral amino acid transporter SnatA (MarC family)
MPRGRRVLSIPACCPRGAAIPPFSHDRFDAPMPQIHLDATLFATAFVTVLVIMDPLGNVPVFLSLTRGQTLGQLRRSALVASLVAGGVILSFALFGQQVPDLLGISLESLQVAGGLLLLVIALELRRSGHTRPDDAKSSNIALVPLGTRCWQARAPSPPPCSTPARPRAPAGRSRCCWPLVAVLAVVYVSIRYAGLPGRILRDNGIDLLSRVMGLLVAAIAVSWSPRPSRPGSDAASDRHHGP